MTEIFAKEQVEQSAKLDVYELATSLLINEGSGKFKVKQLPREAQMTPTYGIEIIDVNNDGNKDLLLGGNLYNAKPEVGRYDASYGLVLLGDAKGNFNSVSTTISGLNMDGEVRDIITIKNFRGDLILATRNNDSILAFKLKKSDPSM